MIPLRYSSFVTAIALLAGVEFSAAGQGNQSGLPHAQITQSGARPEQLVLSAIRANPLTASYPIVVTWQKGKVVLSGAVGTKQVHDMVVRLAINVGVPFRDDLVIDTGTAHVVAQAAPSGNSGASPYVYPPPLFGRLDDPFFGFVPPLVSFPPWWQRRTQTGPLVPPNRAAGAGAATGASSEGWRALNIDNVLGQVEISVDVTGHVFLRGTVASEEAARAAIAAARSVRGVTGVSSQLQVVPRRADQEPANPPPPPVPLQDPAVRGEPAHPLQPALPATPGVRPRPAPAASAAPAALDSQPLTRRVVAALERRPIAAELPVSVRSVDGVVTLAGRVPTTYEAMIVFRAAQQTPGVHEIVDHLEFIVPDEDHPNSLVNKGRPEDVEPYLASQFRRHVGDLAHLDRIQSQGDVLGLYGTIEHAADQERLLAILRSIPVFHGFRLETRFQPQ